MNKLFTLAVLGILVSTGCSNRNVVEVQEHKRYVQPVWFTECKDSGSESNGWKFWSSTDYYYSCGSGMSLNLQLISKQHKLQKEILQIDL